MSEERPSIVIASTESLDQISVVLLMGLTTDGAHHKQWALALALRLLADDRFVEDAQAEFGFDLGVAP